MFARKFNWTLPLHLLLVLGLLAGFAGCGDDDDDDDDVVTSDPTELTRSGWSAFENLNFQAAIEYFRLAIEQEPETVDPYSGAGWTLYMMGAPLDSAQSIWLEGRSVSNIGGVNDIRYGLGSSHLDAGQYGQAITYLDSVATTNPSYRFIHLEGHDINDVFLGLAYAYYIRGEFIQALGYVQRPGLNPLFEANVTTAEGVAALAEEIERLAGIVGG
jgi:tetratricopeptide (TPR) repeat protein